MNTNQRGKNWERNKAIEMQSLNQNNSANALARITVHHGAVIARLQRKLHSLHKRSAAQHRALRAANARNGALLGELAQMKEARGDFDPIASDTINR